VVEIFKKIRQFRWVKVAFHYVGFALLELFGKK